MTTENDKLMQVVGGISAVIIGFVLNAIISTERELRNDTQGLIDRISVLEVRVQIMEERQNKVIESAQWRNTDKVLP